MMKPTIHWKVPFDKSPAKELANAARKGLNWDELVREIWNGTEAMIRCEIAYRAKHRAEKLGMPGMKEHHSRLENSSNEESVGHLRRSVALLRSTYEAVDAEQKKELTKTARNPENLQMLRTKALESFKLSLLDVDIDAEAAGETVEIYNDTLSDVVEKSGFEGLVDHTEKRLNELIKKRSEKDRGRHEFHSPLPWWKWVLIASVIGVSLAVLVACIFWQGCTWMLIVVRALSLYIAYLVRMGC